MEPEFICSFCFQKTPKHISKHTELGGTRKRGSGKNRAEIRSIICVSEETYWEGQH